MDYKTLLIGSLSSALVALLTGKFIRKLILLLVEQVTSRTKNKIDDELLEQAEEDLGVKLDDDTKKG